MDYVINTMAGAGILFECIVVLIGGSVILDTLQRKYNIRRFSNWVDHPVVEGIMGFGGVLFLAFIIGHIFFGDK